ncbi:hypothetical protein VNO78_03270 [Psophocarpus tetragonolobus]|uniref:Uncharacterized protein n=1 Tax=Psophocarpus tetragonolobus TaxID=3891 RepID=A0AAN9XVZ0_PSOTE
MHYLWILYTASVETSSAILELGYYLTVVQSNSKTQRIQNDSRYFSSACYWMNLMKCSHFKASKLSAGWLLLCVLESRDGGESHPLIFFVRPCRVNVPYWLLGRACLSH